MKNIQISQELFIDLIDYHLLDHFDKEEAIKKGLEVKIDSIIKREKYTKSKTALTEEEREKARQEYLDIVGMHPSFRW